MNRIGVLDLQGDVSEHVSTIEKAMKETKTEGCVIKVKTREEVKKLDALIIPGGESTTIGKLIKKYGICSEIKKLAKEKKPILGTCAGLILLAKNNNSLGIMNIKAKRNAFGRQKESFETKLLIPPLGIEPYPAVFIRAPYIQEVGRDVEILARYNKKIVAARQDNLLAAAFHPELTEDLRFQKYFLSMLKK